jgi:hypothetical protein
MTFLRRRKEHKMLMNGQTLRHRKTGKLARLDPSPNTTFAWNIGKETAFIAEDGTKFIDDSKDYTHIEDELGRPYANAPEQGQFVDESAKKYLVSEKELLKMRQKRLEQWEAEVLHRMEHGGEPDEVRVDPDGTRHIKHGKHSCDVAGKMVLCPFSDGSRSLLFEKFFLKHRKAVPLFKKYEKFTKDGWRDGPMVFRHTDGQFWLYDSHLNRLIVIRSNSNILDGG